MIYGNTQSLFYELFYELILNPKLEYLQKKMNTMKNIISAIVMSLLPMWASAQNQGRRVSIIPHAGLTISKMDGSALTASKEWKAGYTFGACVEIPLSQYYSLTTGADFSLIGTGFKEQKEKYASANEKLDVTYVSVPLQVKA